MSKAFSKSKMKVSTGPPLSKILAQSTITVISCVSQLCFFRNACCLSDKSLYSSKCAIIFEQTICSSNLHGTQVRESGRSLQAFPLSYIGDICLQVTIPWGFHQCQQTVERGEQALQSSRKFSRLYRTFGLVN